MWAAQTNPSGSGGPAAWKLISLLCSLNGPVPFWFFWIPDPPVQPGVSILPVASYQTPLDTVSLPFSVLCNEMQFQIASSSLFLSPTPLVSFICGPFSYGGQIITADEHKDVFTRLTPSAQKKERSKIRWFLMKNLFFNKTEKAIKLR